MGKLNRRKFCACGCGTIIYNNCTWANGHNARGINGFILLTKVIPNDHECECECGCGELVASNRRFKYGHGGRGRTHVGRKRIRPIPIPNHHECECGCGELVASNRTYVNHHFKIKWGPMTEEQKVKLHKPHAPFTEEHKQNLRKPNSEEGRRRKKEASNTPEAHQYQSERSLRLWRDPNFIEKQRIGRDIKPNKPESLLKIKFFVWQPKIIYCGDYSVMINGKCPDFICFEKKKIIEFNGNHWHRNDIPGLRESIFAECGYDTLILVDEDLLDMDLLQIKVDEFMERPNPHTILQEVG